MHEYSLAQNIVEIVTESVRKAKKTKVNSITLEIGELSGVEESALLTALESLTPATLLSEGKIEIIHTEGIATCLECKHNFKTSELYSLCPLCNGYAKEIISGREFNVKSIEAE